MYTEEELLEAVDILVEEYGIDEDEAIDLVNEAYEEELLAEGIKNLPNSARNFRDDLQGYAKVSGKKWASQQRDAGFTDEDMQASRDAVRQGLKSSGKQFAKDAAVPAAVAGTALVAGGALAARKAYKDKQARKRRLFKIRAAKKRRRR